MAAWVSAWVVAAVAVLPCAAAAPAAPAGGPAGPAYRTLAVIGSPALRESGVYDLVAAEVGRIPGVRLVERDRLDAIATEWEAATLLGAESAGRRLKVGQLVRADALVILAEPDAAVPAGKPGLPQTRPTTRAAGAVPPAAPAGAPPRAVRVVVSDCRLGARLYAADVPYAADQSAALAAAVAADVAAVRDRYPTGVRWVVGASPFISKNLTHEYDSYQRSFAALLGHAVSSPTAGVAILELEEARAVAGEQALAAGAAGPPVGGGAAPAGRVVPVIVEGEFEVKGLPPAAASTRPAGSATGPATGPATGAAAAADRAGARVAFSIRLSGGAGGGADQTLRREVALADAGAFLSGDAAAAVLRTATVGQHRPVDPAGQFASLAARADAFARLGALPLAADLREAALLLRPDDAPQRRALVREYARLKGSLHTYHPAKPWPDDEERAAQTRLVDGYFARAIDHLEHLVRRRAVPRAEATDLMARCYGFAAGSFPVEYPHYRRLLLDLGPLVLGLDAASPADDGPERAAWLWVMYSAVPSAASQRLPVPAADREATADLIERILPGDVRPPFGLLEMFDDPPPSPYLRPPADAPATREAMIRRAERSGKPTYRLCAAYGRLAELVRKEAPNPKADPADLMRRVDALAAEYRAMNLHAPPPVQPYLHDPVAIRLNDLRWRIWNAAKARGVVLPRPDDLGGLAATTRPVVAAAPTTAPAGGEGDTLWFVPVALRVKTLDGEVRPFADPRSGRSFAGQQLKLLGCGDRLDVMYTANALYWWRAPDLLEEVAGPPPPPQPPGRRGPPWRRGYHGAAWDGRMVWVCSSLGTAQPDLYSLLVFDADGRHVAQVGPEQGLPEGVTLVHPLSPGKVIAIGSIRPHNRAWCAVIDLDLDLGGAGAGGGAAKPKVNVFHTATAVYDGPRMARLPGPSEQAGAAPPGPDATFQPRWATECRPSADGPPLLLVGRVGAGTLPYPLVIDPQTLKVSVSPAPLATDPSPLYGPVWSGGHLVVASQRSVSRVAVSAADGGPGPAASLYSAPPPDRARPLPYQQGIMSGQILVRDGLLYVPGAASPPNPVWLRIDPRSWDVRPMTIDDAVRKQGVFEHFGVSGRFGLLAWGKEMCRLIPAAARPPSALCVRMGFAGAGVHVERVLLPADAPDPSRVKPWAEIEPPAGVKADWSQAVPVETLLEVLQAARPYGDARIVALHRLARTERQAAQSHAKRKDVTAALLPLVLDRSNDVRRPAVAALAAWYGPECLPPLLAKFDDPDPTTRLAAWHVVAQCGDPAAIPAFVERLPKDPHSAANCLAALGPAAEPALIPFLKSPDFGPRSAACRALSLVGSAASLPELRVLVAAETDVRVIEDAKLAIELIQEQE